MSEQLKRFQFFTQETLIEKPLSLPDPTSPTLNDIDISQNGALSIDSRLFFCSKKKALIYIYENNSILCSFAPFSDSINFMERTSGGKEGWLVVVGVDNEGGGKGTTVKVFENEGIDVMNPKNISI